MSKENRRRCPDCLGMEYFAFPERGNGICKRCQGEGQIPELVDMFTALVDADSIHICPECSGTKQCQTCGGTGFEYYNDYDDDGSYAENENSYNDNDSYRTSYSPDYSGDCSYYSSSNGSYSNSSDSSANKNEASMIRIVTILFGLIGFFKACGNYTTAFGVPNGVTNAVNSSYFGIFLFLNLVIYPIIGVVIGWILVKVIFFFSKNSK